MAQFFNAALVGYLVAAVFFCLSAWKRKGLLWKGATGLFVLTFLLHTIGIIGRWIQAGRAPLSNMFESLVFLAWATALAFLIFALRRGIGFLNVGATLFIVLTLAYAGFFDAAIQPLMPALQSNWLTIHVITVLLGYGALGLGFVTSLLFLFLQKQSRAAVLDEISYRAISFGFIFLAAGIITGAVWANKAWGTYWSWDPKETWSLITWIIYAGYLHLRFFRNWRGKRAAWLSVGGFIAVIFTYLGVNFLLSGLHSYT